MILCCIGFSEEKLSWVDENSKNLLIFVDDKPLKIDHPRVKTYFIHSPLQIYSIANEIAEEGVLLPLKTVNLSKSWDFLPFEEIILSTHRRMSLLLSDVADFGCQAFRNAKKNLSTPFRILEDLEGIYNGIPAVIVGAGPSLEDHAENLEKIQKNALIFAGGHALEKIPLKPHFGALLDKGDPLYLPKYSDIPLFFQARAHPFSWEGERILVPDGHFSFINAITKSASFESGWTVGNFMAQIALALGCNPIISVGMDYQLKGQKKYAYDDERLEEVPDDWIEAVFWMQDLVNKYPNTKFLKTSGGINYLPEIDLLELKNWGQIDSHFPNTTLHDPLHFAFWEQSIKEDKPIIYRELLEPLWKLWKAVFEREFKGEQMELHKMLFFEQVKTEYLQCL